MKYDPETFPQRAEEYCKAGATIKDLCRHFGVRSRQTIYNWAKKHPEFLRALMAGRQVADELVEHALFRRAVGFEYNEIEKTVEQTTVVQDKGEGKVAHPAELVKTKTTKKTVVPDTSAQEFWLTNRRPGEWKRKQEVTGADGGAIAVSIQELEGLKDLDVRELARLYSDTLAQSRRAQPGQAATDSGGSSVE